MKNTDLDLAASQLSCDADSTEQEAIDLLKSQYEQIQQLKYQNETKDKTIKTLKNQVKMLNEKVKYFEDNSALRNVSLKINEKRMYLDSLITDLENSGMNILNEKKRQLSVAVSKLDGLSPLGTLSRGFSLSFKADGGLIKSISDVKEKDRIDIRLADGTVVAVAEKIDKY